MSEPDKPDQRDKVDNELMENKPDDGGASGRRRNPPSGRGAPPANREVQAQIGRQLKAVYNDVLSQPIPDRFLDLLQKLDDDKSDK